MAAASKSLTSWEAFNTELKNREVEISSQLPSNVSPEKFTNAAIAAVKQNPDLLEADPRSLFKAVTQAAQDGLLPDGKEGVITAYNNKEARAKEAKWNPMTYGIRKRARELDDIVIDAQVVYMNDHFVWHQGDEPKIEHTPPRLGEPRGQKIGAYAVVRKGTHILHREVMDFGQIEKVKECSRAQKGLLWTTFEEEGWRKTVVRRAMKSVPVSADLESVLRRDDDQFDFDQPPHNPVAQMPPPRRDTAFSRAPVIEDASDGDVEEVKAVAARPTPSDVGEKAASVVEVLNTAKDAVGRDDEHKDWVKGVFSGIEYITKVRDIPAYQDRIVEAGVMTEKQEAEFIAACEARAIEIMEAAKRARP
jgi:recombination protein RecT